MQPFLIIEKPIKEATLNLEAVHRDLCLLELSPLRYIRTRTENSHENDRTGLDPTKRSQADILSTDRGTCTREICVWRRINIQHHWIIFLFCMLKAGTNNYKERETKLGNCECDHWCSTFQGLTRNAYACRSRPGVGRSPRCGHHTGGQGKYGAVLSLLGPH